MTIKTRWIGAATGIALAAADTALAVSGGVTFSISGRDATIGVFAFLAVSFGLFGFLVGWLVDARRAEASAAAEARAHREALAVLERRLARVDKMATLGQLASAIAHEVRNPLAVIRSTVQNVRESLPGDADDARRDCGFVMEEIDRLGRVSSMLLDLARPTRLARGSHHVAALVERVALLATPLLEPRSVRLRLDVAADLPPLHVDADLTCQVLLGLIDNAGDVSRPGDEIHLSARRDGGHVALTVADRGPGVPDDLRERVFEPFFTTRERGTGLGLAVARQIVVAHGGRIAIGNAEGGGAEFRVELPAAQRSCAA